MVAFYFQIKHAHKTSFPYLLYTPSPKFALAYVLIILIIYIFAIKFWKGPGYFDFVKLQNIFTPNSLSTARFVGVVFSAGDFTPQILIDNFLCARYCV